jgi:exonuclease VII small subunit
MRLEKSEADNVLHLTQLSRGSEYVDQLNKQLQDAQEQIDNLQSQQEGEDMNDYKCICIFVCIYIYIYI